MNNFIHLVLVFVSGFFIFFILKQSHFNFKKPLIINEEPKKIIIQNEILNFINNQKSKINNIKVNSIVVQNKINRFTTSSSGFLFYEKDKNFRLVLNSLFGKELDIGSNSHLFWYWAKRSTEKALYFSPHEHIKNTRLKEPVNPLFLKTVLLLDKIPTQNSKVFKSENYIFIEWETESINYDKKLTCCLKLNKKNYKPCNMMLKDPNNKLIAEIIVQNVFLHEQVYLPQNIKILWPEENIEMTWDLKDMEINTNINALYWNMPNYGKRIDISKD